MQTALCKNSHRFSVHWMWQWLSCSHGQEVQEIITVLICIYINWSTVLSLHTLEAYIHLFLTLALDGGQQAASHLGILFLVEIPPVMHWMGGCLGHITSLVAGGNEKNLFCHFCESKSSSLVQIIAYFCVILGIQIETLKFHNCFKTGGWHWQFSPGFGQNG